MHLANCTQSDIAYTAESAGAMDVGLEGLNTLQALGCNGHIVYICSRYIVWIA
jgi:hypothetical protein